MILATTSSCCGLPYPALALPPEATLSINPSVSAAPQDEFAAVAPEYPGFGADVAGPGDTADYICMHYANLIGGFSSPMRFSRFAAYCFDHDNSVSSRLPPPRLQPSNAPSFKNRIGNGVRLLSDGEPLLCRGTDGPQVQLPAMTMSLEPDAVLAQYGFANDSAHVEPKETTRLPVSIPAMRKSISIGSPIALVT